MLAQNNTALVTDIVATPNYFLVVLFGVMLAIGFQFLLTSLSVAIGVSAIPDLKKTYAHARYGKSDNGDSDDNWNETDDSAPTGVMVSSALGIWNVVTAAISLFGATALALTLTPIVTTTIAITLGLTIWAVFYLLMFYFEGKMVGTAIGGLISTAVSGLRAGGEAVKNMFTPSPASQVESVATTTIEKLRKEMDATFDTDGISKAIDNFTNTVGKKLDNNLGSVPSYDKIKADLKEVVKAGGNQSNPAKWTAIQSAIQSAIDSNDNDDDNDSSEQSDKKKQLQELLAEAKKAINSDGGDNGGRGSILEKAREYEGKVTAYLEKAAPEEFDTEQLVTNLKKLASDPKGGSQGLTEQFGQIDQDVIVKAISKNTSLDKEQVESYVQKASDALSTFMGSSDDAGKDGQLSVKGGAKIVSQKATALLDGLEGSIASFIDGTDDPRLNYSDLKNDFVKMFNNPNESVDIISKRLDSYDRDTLVSVLTNNSRLSRADINNVVTQVEDARTQVKDQIQTIKDKANSAMNQTARRAAIEADHARKTAVAASWWLFTAIVASGVAAVFGAITGI